MKRILVLLFVVLLAWQYSFSQLQPGYNKAEYIDLLKVSARHGDSAYFQKLPKPEHASFVYTSPVVGLDNCWQLWIREDSVGIISIRGTIGSQLSWLANLYAAMLPAQGIITLKGNIIFPYHLADHPKAAVHSGWLVAMAYLANDILPKMDSVYTKGGIKDWIVMGHSQGGAIAYLLTAHLYSLQHQHKLPADIRIKTYCSAAPKPGNLYFAYEYEAKTQEGWAYNVVNSADWVPETPFSVQTINDFNKTNVFVLAPGLIKKQKIPKRWVLKYAFNRLDKPTKKAQRNFEKYLGRMVGKQVGSQVEGMKLPGYYPSADYVRTGNTIVLLADEEYYRKYKDSDSASHVFVHHLFEPYLHLAAKLADTHRQTSGTALNE